LRIKAGWRSATARGKAMDLTSEVHVSVRGEKEGKSGERRNPVEKPYSGECAKGARAKWAWRELIACEEGQTSEGRIGLAEPNPRRCFKWKLIYNFKDFWNLVAI
jgi:hypothetical protein